LPSAVTLLLTGYLLDIGGWETRCHDGSRCPDQLAGNVRYPAGERRGSGPGEAALIEALASAPEQFADRDMVVIRYEGPRGAPGMPEMLDPTSRITVLCRQRGITIALMTDARFSGGSVGVVIGHVSPEAALGGPIALIENGDTIVVDVNQDTLDCAELADPATLTARRDWWQAEASRNSGVHPLVRTADTRLLRRMRARANE